MNPSDTPPVNPEGGATPNAPALAVVERLRAWAPMVSSGYTVPAAGQPMLEAADTITALYEALEALVEEVEGVGGEACDGSDNPVEQALHNARAALARTGEAS